MNPLLETWLVAARDIRKNVRSAKGIVMFGISLLGALACTFKLPKFEEGLSDLKKLDPAQIHEAKVQMFSKLYSDEAAGRVLADAPIKLVILFFIAVWLVPLLVMIIGFDGISSDLQYRSIRYWAVRARRGSYYAGKFLALWAVIASVTLLMQVMIWAVTIVRADAPAMETVNWGLRFWVTTLPITGAWCGVATLTSSLFRAPMLSLLATTGTFSLLFFAGFVVGKLAEVPYLKYLYPNNFDAWIISDNHEHVLAGVGVCAVFVIVTSALGGTALATRDV